MISSSSKEPVILMALGNLARGDDGFAIELLRYMAKHFKLPSDLLLIEAACNPLAYSQRIGDSRWLILLDALQGQLPSRQIVVCDPYRPAAANQPLLSSHRIKADSLLVLLDTLALSPARVSLLGVRAEQLMSGDPVSLPLRQLLPAAASELVNLLAGEGVLLVAQDA